jgi:hypothetical protein
MKRSTCSCKTREQVKPDVRQRLARYANFACSICGSIPIVFHHIEEWSQKFSNDEEFLIPICDKCHRRIHGEGGCLYSKRELYEFKNAPKRPSILTDELPLEHKRCYSFFVGCNFIANGERTTLFRFPEGHHLASVDTSSGTLKLSILASIQGSKTVYLIRDNELLIDSQDVWDMKYSGNSLQIWRRSDHRKSIFIDLVILPDVIIIRRMNTTFNGKTFQIRKLRSPQRRQVDRIANQVKQYEELYREMSVEIDSRPKTGDAFGGIDVDTLIKQTQKDALKTRMEQELSHGFYRNFKWPWPYYQWVLSGVLVKSPVFGRGRDIPMELGTMHEMIASIRAKYEKEFEDLAGVVVEYDGEVWLDNINL